MITVITQFPLPPGLDLAVFRQQIVAIAPEFQKPAGLLSKAFVVSDDGAHAGGVYLWRIREHALAFEPDIRAMIKDRIGAEALITYFETPVLVDNQRQTIEVAPGV
jgi:hypothetical protein